MTEIRQQRSEVRKQREEINRRDANGAAMKKSARGDSSTGSELKAVEEACREASRTVEPCALYAPVVRRISDFRLLTSALCALLFALSVSVEAQQPARKIPRIGFVANGSASDPATAIRLDAFRQGLRDLGFIEGKNLNIEYRFAEGKPEQSPKLAEDLVRLNVDILVVPNDLTARAAKKATTTIPIVMTSSGNPIGTGVIASLARPGGNITGLTSYNAELLGKRLGLLKEVLPKVTRFAFLSDASNEASASRAAFKDAQGPAKVLGVQLLSVPVKAPNPDFDGAFRVMANERIGALITSPSPLISLHQKKILRLIEQNRIPAVHTTPEWTNAGGLMSYGANQVELSRRAAVYVDKILKGAKPADLPVEQPTKFEFVINLKAANALNLKIPQSVLYRADKVIK